MKWLAAALATAACGRAAQVETCSDDLHGVWRDAAGHSWMMLDNATSLEAYPMFDDAPPISAEIVLAPSVIDLHRAGRGLDGEAKRRFMKRAATCEARAPFHVTACANDALEVVTSELEGPVTYAPCVWPPAALSRVEQWRRKR